MSENSKKFDERKLFEPLDRSLVGNDGRGNDIIAWYLVADRLNRWFGPTGWDLETTRPRLLWAGTTTKDQHSVTYSTHATLTVRINGRSTSKSASGSHTSVSRDPGVAHENASLSAGSIAFKRAARYLGEAFGIGLYQGKERIPRNAPMEFLKSEALDEYQAARQETDRRRKNGHTHPARTSSPDAIVTDAAEAGVNTINDIDALVAKVGGPVHPDFPAAPRDVLQHIEDELSRVNQLHSGARASLTKRIRARYEVTSLFQLPQDKLQEILSNLVNMSAENIGRILEK